MLLKTFLNRLVIQPDNVRHDSYDNKDILQFKSCEGYFPYVEFQSMPINGVQEIYFDVLNWNIKNSRYVIKENMHNTVDFIKLIKMTAENKLSTLDEINKRLISFYMLFNDKQLA